MEDDIRAFLKGMPSGSNPEAFLRAHNEAQLLQYEANFRQLSKLLTAFRRILVEEGWTEFGAEAIVTHYFDVITTPSVMRHFQGDDS